ncbi:hypothetical protein DTW90_18340 [Neorhizobium sp. P12A]|uniref:hypothetical protein n=1 Tax=Neorhizobium sp. P12A TaxID=2268027 RepID=UPI0011EBD1E2|nr:hypothetical protein [Neorhizobium sp. P12A]KAA0697391.1 hypothetical protein DTW90_18340 [Neorhizobium sp. P12A]
MMTTQNRYDEIRAAFFEVLQTLGVEPGKPISNYDIGPPMVMRGFTQDEIVHVLFSLQTRKVIALLPGNRIELLEPAAK